MYKFSEVKKLGFTCYMGYLLQWCRSIRFFN